MPTNTDTDDHATTADYADEADTLDGYHADEIIEEAIRRIREEAADE